MDSICSERLVLRRFDEGDAVGLAAYRSDPEVARYQSWDAPFTLHDASSLIAGLAVGDPGSPGWFQWAIERIDEPGLVGDLGVNLLEDEQQAAIGYTMAPAFQGRGYATEAVACMLEHLFAEKGLHRVSAECDTRNEASVRVLEHLGFRREAHLKASTWSKGEWCDDYLYGLLAEEWLRVAAPDR